MPFLTWENRDKPLNLGFCGSGKHLLCGGGVFLIHIDVMYPLKAHIYYNNYKFINMVILGVNSDQEFTLRIDL